MSDQPSQIAFEKDCLRLAGELTIYNVATLAAELVARWDQHSPGLVDLADVQQLDCAGLQLLLALQQHARHAGRDFRIVQPSTVVQNVLLLCRLSDRLDHVPADPATRRAVAA